jgi:chemotaxis protein MotA
MDIATIIGIVTAFALVFLAIFLGSGLVIFIDFPSLAIVVGGVIGVTLIHYPLSDMIKVMSVALKTLFPSRTDPTGYIQELVKFSWVARKDGILALEDAAEGIRNSYFKKGIQLAVDGLENQEIKEILETDMQQLQERHKLGAEIFTSMGSYGPAMGMIGTLIGLVQMLQSMSDPSSIGPAMALALLTTFYGSVMANMLFLPLAGKLKNSSSKETLVKEVIMEGILAISNGDNPRVVEQKLHSFIAPKLRRSTFGD